MKAIIYSHYGSPDVLELIGLPVPQHQKGEVLIQIKAIGLNPRDRNIRNGDLKFISGKDFPKLTGADFSGIITDLGDGVINLKIGQEVFGYIDDVKKGASAEYIAIPEKYVAVKPDPISFEVASTLGCAYLTALQTLRDKCEIKSGDKIVIYGASGGVGIAAIQLAKYFGATVTAISHSSHEMLCKTQGADKFIAYDKADVFSMPEKFDIFFQVYSKQAYYDKAKSILRPNGVYICLIPDPRFLLQILFARPRFKSILVKTKKADLDFIANLAMKRAINPFISNQFQLEDMREAHKLIEGEHSSGRVVITMRPVA
jgi:NADPH:quinone reductase-like Zn-dependent oxidoreductase